MSDIEVGLLTLLAKGVFVAISALCIALSLQGIMAHQGWRAARPMLTWLAWCLLTFLGAFLVMVLANAHTQVSNATLLIRIIAAGYLLLGAGLLLRLLRRLREWSGSDADDI